jgi:hypothetical protein
MDEPRQPCAAASSDVPDATPRHRPPRWRRRVALVTVLALLTPTLLILRDPVLRLGVRSLVQEWTACALRGEVPGPQTGLSAAFVASRPPAAIERPSSESLNLSVVRPQAQLRATVAHSPDRLERTPRRVIVAVLDTGVTSAHGDVHPERVLPGIDLINPCGNGHQDVTGHGTAVAGVLLSTHHGGAPRVDVLPIRISLATGRHASITSALGIVLATRQGADIINMSYTAQRRRPSLAEWLAVRYASKRGVALVAAAGNDPTRRAGFPAAYPQVLSVTAIDKAGVLARSAARTGEIDVAAPGSRVLTLSPDGSVRAASGTSLAAPLVSASLVHLLRADPGITPARAVAMVRDTTGPPPAQPAEALLAHRFGTFNFGAALSGVCAISSTCQLTAVLSRADRDEALPIGDPRRLPRPGEPR